MATLSTLGRPLLIPLSSSQPIFFSNFDVTRQTFYRTNLVFATVNLKPIVPGHSLVCPLRRVQRFSELSSDEISALFLAVQRIGSVLEKAYDAESLTISVQDGEAAGQTVPHLHVHVLPRKFGDFEPNDLVYDELDKHELFEVRFNSSICSGLYAEAAPYFLFPFPNPSLRRVFGCSNCVLKRLRPSVTTLRKRTIDRTSKWTPNFRELHGQLKKWKKKQDGWRASFTVVRMGK